MFYIAQGGAALQTIDTAGAIQTLTLPSGVTIDATKRGRFGILGRQIVFVNAPSVNLWIDPEDLVVRPLAIAPPVNGPTLAAGAATGLTGTYKAWTSYVIKNQAGVLLNESPLSPVSNAVALTDDKLNFTFIAVSPNALVTGRRLYRTVAGGEVPFLMVDIDDNASTTFVTALADAALELLPSDPELGNPPGSTPGTRMELIAVWRNRLWGKAAAFELVDRILFSDLEHFYAWSATNFLLATPAGEDQIGITGFMPRRDELVVTKRSRVLKVIGNDESDFEVIIVAEGVGCIAPDSTVVVRDVGYFLGTDGVYSIGPLGVSPLSRDKVDPWFLSDDYFNRELFPEAIGGYNQSTDTYDLHLAAAGSTVLDRWVSYDIRRKEWLGPHRTGALTPTCRAFLTNEDGSGRPTMGSAAGHLWEMNQPGASDGGTAISISWVTKRYTGQAPDIMHFWGQPTIHVKKQSNTAGNLTMASAVGNLDAVTTNTDAIPMRRTRTELGRLGAGISAQLTFTHATDAEDVDLRGYELPFIEIGRRPTDRE